MDDIFLVLVLDLPPVFEDENENEEEGTVIRSSVQCCGPGVFTYYNPGAIGSKRMAEIYMRTLLRHTRTGLYFAGPDKWTNTPDRAYDFRFVDRAVQYVETWDLKEVELAFAFDDPQSVTTMPLDKAAPQYAAA